MIVFIFHSNQLTGKRDFTLKSLLPSQLIKKFPLWCSVNFVSVFTALNNTKSKENLTLHHMGKFFIS